VKESAKVVRVIESPEQAAEQAERVAKKGRQAMSPSIVSLYEGIDKELSQTIPAAVLELLYEGIDPNSLPLVLHYWIQGRHISLVVYDRKTGQARTVCYSLAFK